MSDQGMSVGTGGGGISKLLAVQKAVGLSLRRISDDGCVFPFSILAKKKPTTTTNIQINEHFGCIRSICKYLIYAYKNNVPF